MLGVHVTKESHVLDDKTASDDLSDAITRDMGALDLNCAQVFTFGPRFPVPCKIDHEAVKKATKQIDLSVHSAYPTTSIWKICSDTDAVKQRKLVVFKLQLLSCVKIGAHSMVLHINKIPPDTAARVMKILKPIVKKTKVRLLLEMVASKSHPELTYETPDKINRLPELIEPDKSENWWGWCVDTAHLWGAGVDVTSHADMQNWLNGIKRRDKICMFHLNGSSAALGSGKDKHEIAFGPDDVIWGGTPPKTSGVFAILEFSNGQNIPIICEINRGTEANVRRSIAKIKSMLEDLFF